MNIYNLEVWKRDKQKILAQLHAYAAAAGETLSEDVIEMVSLVLDMENNAYEAGYKKGYTDGKAGK